MLTHHNPGRSCWWTRVPPSWCRRCSQGRTTLETLQPMHVFFISMHDLYLVSCDLNAVLALSTMPSINIIRIRNNIISIPHNPWQSCWWTNVPRSWCLMEANMYVNACIHTCMHTYIHTCMHTYMHTYTHT